jgi:hypothetical protein
MVCLALSARLNRGPDSGLNVQGWRADDGAANARVRLRGDDVPSVYARVHHTAVARACHVTMVAASFGRIAEFHFRSSDVLPHHQVAPACGLRLALGRASLAP